MKVWDKRNDLRIALLIAFLFIILSALYSQGKNIEKIEKKMQSEIGQIKKYMIENKPRVTLLNRR